VDIGHESGLGGRRRLVLTGSLALLVAAALWITDPDQPRSGALRLSDASLEAIKLNASGDAR
jgi:hypothetical protein